MPTNLYRGLADDGLPLDIPERVLTVGAHPDDAEFGAGATLARWADAGAEVTMLIVTDGSKGSWNPEEDQDQLVERRIAEQKAAGAVLGARRCEHLGYVDGDLVYSMDLRNEIALAIRRYTPDIVLGHDPWQRYQLHPDHRATGLATVDAVVAAREPLALKESALEAHRPLAILLWSADEPDHIEPISQRHNDRKIEALLCHSSQGTTSMGDPKGGIAQRAAFMDRIDAWHVASGERLGTVPAEIFKRMTP